MPSAPAHHTFEPVPAPGGPTAALRRRALVTGASGYIGGRLATTLADNGWTVRCMVRDRSRARDLEQHGCELHEADVLRPDTLEGIGRDVDVAYYLIHAMGRGARGDFAPREHAGAEAFAGTTPHTLRRTYISIALLANRFDVLWVMRQVGHADSKMTMDVYAQLQQRAERTHGEAFDGLVRRARERLYGAVENADGSGRPPAQSAEDVLDDWSLDSEDR
jgi:NAD(P)-dependent dehydrogenase (short-subunit alcohol dehydrogenase family)